MSKKYFLTKDGLLSVAEKRLEYSLVKESSTLLEHRVLYTVKDQAGRKVLDLTLESPFFSMFADKSIKVKTEDETVQLSSEVESLQRKLTVKENEWELEGTGVGLLWKREGKEIAFLREENPPIVEIVDEKFHDVAVGVAFAYSLLA